MGKLDSKVTDMTRKNAGEVRGMPSITEMANNIKGMYDNASGYAKIEGAGWYLRAHDRCVRLSQEFNLSMFAACGIFAALSPRNAWENNISDAWLLCGALVDGTELQDLQGIHAFQANVQKAIKIWEADQRCPVSGNQVREILHGRKTISFFNCLANPVQLSEVCIDTWAARVATGWQAGDSDVNLTPNRYALLQAAYREALIDINSRYPQYPTLPLQLQAVCWVAIREREGVYKDW